MDNVLVIGGGLAGGLLSLALADRGCAVALLSAPGPSATALSYGGVPWWTGPPGPIGALMATAPACWQALEERHGSLGWRPCGLLLHGPGGRLERHPYARLDGAHLASALPMALERAGVKPFCGVATGLRSKAGGGWTVELAGVEALSADQVVLAAGAGNLALWPALAGTLLVSWAGVLLSERRPAATALPWHSASVESETVTDADAIVMPLVGRRQALEALAPTLTAEQWVVDVGLAPRGAGLLLGQTTLVRPGAELGMPPGPPLLEAALRAELKTLWPELAALPARFLQVPVTFTASGRPLAGAIAGHPGLWVFSGFSSPFALVPPLTPLLAAAIAGEVSAQAELSRLLTTER